MTDPTRADGTSSLPRRRRRRSAALATALATLMLGAAGQIAGQPAAAAEAHVDNPFAGATFYVNPDYAELVDTSIAQTSDATLKAKMAKVKSYPTAVWMDRIAAVHGGEDNEIGRASCRERV